MRTSHYGDELRFDIVAVDDEKRGEREVGEVGKNGRGNSCRQQGGGECKDGGGDNAKSCGNYYDTGVNDADLSRGIPRVWIPFKLVVESCPTSFTFSLNICTFL